MLICALNYLLQYWINMQSPDSTSLKCKTKNISKILIWMKKKIQTANASDTPKFSFIFHGRYISPLDSHKRNESFLRAVIKHAFIAHIVFC